jgi:hypothetical protein
VINQDDIPRASFCELLRRAIWLIFLIALPCAPSTLNAQNNLRSLSDEAPLWSVKARQVGYDPSVFARSYWALVGGDQVKPQFLDDQRLALSWLTLDKTPKKASVPSANAPSHLHLSILDIRDGHLLANHEWECSPVGVDVAYTASGQWLLSVGNSVSLYSPSFEKLTALQDIRVQSISPTDRTFLSFAANSSGRQSGQLRDAASLRVLDSWNDSRVEKARILYSDRFFLAEILQPPRAANLHIRKVGGTWSLYLPSGPPLRYLGFANDDTLVAMSRGKLVAKTVGGSELFELAMPRHGLFPISWSTSDTSQKGDRFALILGRMRGLRNDALDMYPFWSEDRVLVYGISQRDVIFAAKVKGPSPWPINRYPVWNRIALSPDGLLLAIASNEGVRVYALPPGGQRRH